MTARPVHFYCYYRVDPMRSSAARDAVAALFRVVEERLGVVGRLLEGEREPTLWMEIYEPVLEPERLETLLAELCASHRFAALLAEGSTRRIERFTAA